MSLPKFGDEELRSEVIQLYNSQRLARARGKDLDRLAELYGFEPRFYRKRALIRMLVSLIVISMWVLVALQCLVLMGRHYGN